MYFSKKKNWGKRRKEKRNFFVNFVFEKLSRVFLVVVIIIIEL